MLFYEFLDKTTTLKSKPLGGQEAQFKLAPALRLGYDDEKIRARNPKKAAVLSLFYPNEKNETCFLLTERASYKGTHSARVCVCFLFAFFCMYVCILFTYHSG